MLKPDAVAALSRVLKRSALWGALVTVVTCIEQLPLWNGRCWPLVWMLPLVAWRLHGRVAGWLVLLCVCYVLV